MKHTYDAKRNLWTRADFTGIAYSDGSEFEASLLGVMQQAKDKSVFSNELAAYIRDWPSEYHLTTSRHCLVRPVPFQAGETVLELGCGCGAITRHLGELGLDVTAVEGGAKRAEIVAERVRDLPNVKVVFDDLVQFQSEEKYDWVTLIGVLEYSPMFAPGDDPVSAYLKQALSYLKPGGRLVVAIENQLGLKYFNGCGEDHVNIPFFGTQGLYEPGGPITFGKEQLRSRLLDIGFAGVDFYYPYPDYKIPQAILSEQAFDAKDFKVADMLLRMDPRDYTGRNLRLFSEQLVARVLEDNGVLSDFSNSFLAIASLDSRTPDEDATKPIAWCFSLNRLPQYKTETTFHQLVDRIEVRKALVAPPAQRPPTTQTRLRHHLGNSTYSFGRLQAWEILQAKLRPYHEEAFARSFIPYVQYLLSKSHVTPGQNPERLESWQTSGSLIDLTPFNLVKAPDSTTAIDMEWELPGNIPTGWILMRSVIHSLTLGVTPAAAQQTTIGSLMQTIAGLAGMHYADQSFRLWGQHEQEFLETVCGIKTRRITPDIPIPRLCHFFKFDIDHPGVTSPGAMQPGQSRRKQIVIDENANQHAASPSGHLPVSAILITYQQRELVLKALRSLLTQDYPIDEIIISDDGSTDGTLEAILSMEALLRSRCENLVIRQNPKNLGIIAHFNLAFELARNEFIVYFAGDDISEPHRIRRLAETYRQVGSPRYCLIHSDVRMMDADDGLGDLFQPPVITDNLDFMGIALSGRLHVGATAAFTRALWADYGGFEEPWVYEDLVLGWRAAMHNHYHYLAEPLLRYRSGGVTFQPVTPEKQRQHFISLLRQRLADTRLADDAGLRTDLGDIRHRLSLDLNAFESSQAFSEFDLAYVRWRASRRPLPEDIRIIRENLDTTPAGNASFQIVIRLAENAKPALADTLDALNTQVFPNWRVDLVTTLPRPKGMENVACLGWHTIENIDLASTTINAIVDAGSSSWIIELPAGAKPDPLFLWHIAVEGCRSPDISALFVDDDCSDEFGERHNPRFKPGTNPTALKAADLAGPLCIRKSVWQAIGGAPAEHGSPWFEQLLRIADLSGWKAIKHISDILLTYPIALPTDPEACLRALISLHDEKRFPIEIVPTTETSWNIQPLTETLPPVTIAILSIGQLDLLTRCIGSLVENTNYPHVELLITLTDTCNDPDLNDWLTKQQEEGLPIRLIKTSDSATRAERCNKAIQSARHDLVLLMEDEVVIIQPSWLEELVKTISETGVVAVSPRMVAPGSDAIFHAGVTLGLKGIAGTQTDNQTRLGDHGYLDALSIARDVQALPQGCFLIDKPSYLQVGGMETGIFGTHMAEIDLSLKLIQKQQRIIFQPLASIAYSGPTFAPTGMEQVERANFIANRARAETAMLEKWGISCLSDPYWNKNLSLTKGRPIPDVECHAQWQYLPTEGPKFLARTLPNGQGVFRITAALRALRKAGKASECVWDQEASREPSVAEIARQSPTVLIVQHYIQEPQLKTLDDCFRLRNRPFMIFTADDLLTNLPDGNPMRKNLPTNSRSCLKYALDRCDRLVVSTDYLADCYSKLIKDIQVVPNWLEQETWLPLTSHKRTSERPRIGWAGGTTHQSDLILLKEVIEQTRDEADWVFFGMCPSEIRPLVAEFHPLASFAEYPARLAALNLDIAVAPLQDHPFNHGKSNLRLLEYGVLGIPVVCSDMTPYRNSPACCVPNSASAWIEALRTRIHDADARETEGLALKRWVRKHYLLENHVDQWLIAHLPG